MQDSQAPRIIRIFSYPKDLLVPVFTFGRTHGLIVLALAVFSPSLAASEPRRVFHVAPKGSDQSGDGSAARPWASLRHATDVMPDLGAELVFQEGNYGPQSLGRAFRKPVIVRARNPYRARWSSLNGRHRALHVQGATNVTISGFEIRGQAGAQGEYLVQITSPETSSILLHNNIIHDSYDNDIVKIN